MSSNRNLQPQIDRLVDGEMSSHESKELFLELDQRSAGWKQLALTFVEAQSWRKEFRAALSGSDDGWVREGGTSSPPTPSQQEEVFSFPIPAVSPPSTTNNNHHLNSLPTRAASAAPSRRVHWTRRLQNIAIASTSLCIAFLAGLLIPRGAAVPPGAPSELASNDTASAARSPAAKSAQSPAAPDRANLQTVSTDGPKHLGNLRFQVPGRNGQFESIEIPTLEVTGNQLDQLSFTNGQESDQLQKLLHAQGQKLDEERFFYPIKTEDGRTVLLQVSRLRVRPAWDPELR